MNDLAHRGSESRACGMHVDYLELTAYAPRQQPSGKKIVRIEWVTQPSPTVAPTDLEGVRSLFAGNADTREHIRAATHVDTHGYAVDQYVMAQHVRSDDQRSRASDDPGGTMHQLCTRKPMELSAIAHPASTARVMTALRPLEVSQRCS